MFWQGETYRQLKQYDEALNHLNKAISHKQEFAQAIGTRGEINLFLQNLDQALQDLGYCIDKYPDDDWRLYSRGLLHLIQKNESNSKSDLDRAISLAKQSHENWLNTCNLVLYLTCVGDLEPANQIVIEARNKLIPIYHLKQMVHDFGELLQLIPEHRNAQIMREQIQKLIADQERLQ
jgi:tetratricopeptide (TPR) repeat protein